MIDLQSRNNLKFGVAERTKVHSVVGPWLLEHCETSRNCRTICLTIFFKTKCLERNFHTLQSDNCKTNVFNFFTCRLFFSESSTKFQVREVRFLYNKMQLTWKCRNTLAAGDQKKKQIRG